MERVEFVAQVFAGTYKAKFFVGQEYQIRYNRMYDMMFRHYYHEVIWC